MATNAPAPVAQFTVNAWAAVPLLALSEHGSHLDGEHPVFLGTRGLLTFEPGVVAAAPHLKHATQIRDGKLGLLRVDEREPHLLRFAKKAVASPRISTSIFSRAFSLRRVFSSSSSSGLIPVFCWASSSFFHFASRLVPRPNSLAT